MDLVRFSAALTVFLFHFGVMNETNSTPFWRFHLRFYSQTSVTVFFVLSGYVIAYVLAARGKTALEYCASRFARLYSVAVPALIVTALSSYLIGAGAGGFPPDLPRDATDLVGRYIGTALFLNQFWIWPSIEVPNNPVFWSLSLEASYYAAAGLVMFAKGRAQILALVALAICAGPRIVPLAPLWAFGYVAYHIGNRIQLSARLASLVWVASAVLLPCCYVLGEVLTVDISTSRFVDQTLGTFLVRYVEAICFATNLVSFNVVSERVYPLLLPFARTIRFLGAMTFALYLLHWPLLNLFANYGVADPSSALQRTWLICGTLAVIATLGTLSERTKGIYKSCFLLLARRPAIAAAAG